MSDGPLHPSPLDAHCHHLFRCRRSGGPTGHRGAPWLRPRDCPARPYKTAERVLNDRPARRTLARVPIAPEPHRVEIRLLGPLEAVVDGRSVPLGGPQARALLSLLAVSVGHAGEPGAADRRHVGRGRPARRVRRTRVQVYISRLRAGHRARGRRRRSSGQRPAATCSTCRPTRSISTGSSGWRRWVTTSWPGRRRRRPGAPWPRRWRLWRGPALPDLDGDAVTALRARLDRRLVTAQAEHADAQIALGHAEQAVAELESLVQLHPLDEGLVGAADDRALPLRAAGGRARGVRRRPATRLADELGVDPGSLLREVHDGVLRQTLDPIAPGPETSWPSRPSRRARLPTAPRHALAPAERPARTAAAVAARERLRSPRGELIGRRAEIQQALDRLADPAVRVVTILGPGGIGKTRLALALAAELDERTGPSSCRWPRSPTRASCSPRSCRPSAPSRSGRARTWSS